MLKIKGRTQQNQNVPIKEKLFTCGNTFCSVGLVVNIPVFNVVVVVVENAENTKRARVQKQEQILWTDLKVG